jgi:transposase
MAKPYSYNLRSKVIAAIQQDGMKKSEVSQLLNISRNTIDLWLKRQAETGDFKALPNRPPGNNHKITDWDKFHQFAKIYGDKTQAELAQLWEAKISARTISRALKKIGLTRKKTYGYRERDETKRQDFIAQLSTLPTEKIVYVDESGMDSRDEYDYGWNLKGQRFHALNSWRRLGRVNMIAALCNQNLMATFTVDRACNPHSADI